MWEWSHAPEAYEALQEHLLVKPRSFLEVVYAEWKSCTGGYFPVRRERACIGTGGFDDRRYQRALSAARYLSTDELAERIFEWSKRQSLCTNGGYEALVCPCGCGVHEIPWEAPADESEAAE